MFQVDHANVFRNAFAGYDARQSEEAENALARMASPTSPLAQYQEPAGSGSQSTGEPDPSEVDWLARAIYSEAGNEPVEGQLAVGAVIDNRRKTGRYGNTFEDVILAPGQFSAFNALTGYAGGAGANDLWQKTPPESVYDVARAVLSGTYSDPTGGALNYYNPDYADPDWGDPSWDRIGNHIFGTAG